MLWIEHNTKEGRRDQHPSTAEKLTVELVAPQPNCGTRHYCGIRH